MSPASLRSRRSPQSANWLVLALCPLLFWLLRGDMGSMVSGLVLISIFGFAGHNIISALEDEEIGEIRPTRYPRKLTGSALIGVGVTGLALLQTSLGVLSPALGFIAFALSIVAFGLDVNVSLKMRLGRKASKDTRSLIDTTERVLAAIPLRVDELRDEPVSLQAYAFRDTMKEMIDVNLERIEALAPELRAVVTEAAEATDEFVEEYMDHPDHTTKRRYMVLLRELADAFALCIEEQIRDEEGEDPTPFRATVRREAA